MQSAVGIAAQVVFTAGVSLLMYTGAPQVEAGSQVAGATIVAAVIIPIALGALFDA